jgi:hypothetical protein
VTKNRNRVEEKKVRISIFEGCERIVGEETICKSDEDGKKERKKKKGRRKKKFRKGFCSDEKNDIPEKESHKNGHPK